MPFVLLLCVGQTGKEKIVALQQLKARRDSGLKVKEETKESQTKHSEIIMSNVTSWALETPSEKIHSSITENNRGSITAI